MTIISKLRRSLDGPASRIPWGRNRAPAAFPPGHYHSTLPSLQDIDEQTHFGIVAIDLRRSEQLALLEKLDVLDPTGPRYKSGNGWFPTADAAIYQAMIRHYRPQHVVEVGCGWSTAALFDAGAAPHVTLIEPYPDRVCQLLSGEDFANCDLVTSRLQDVPLETFHLLNSGDVLFVDSTHVTRLGSDVNRIFFEILPALDSGVIIHFHDIFYPFEYPDDWVREGLGWNEAYLLRAFLEYNDGFEILVWAHMLQLMGQLAVNPEEGIKCASIWLRKL